jgi:hypothetical protein
MIADLPGTLPPPPPPVANEDEQVAPDRQEKRRWSRRHAEDDFGDFTYLHDPEETDPGMPGSHGRRAAR